jgi:hypothetical protein
MEILIQRGANTFKFLDRSFNANIPRAIRIMNFFLDHLPPLAGSQGPAFTVHFEMVPGIFPPELRAVLRRFPAGSLRLEIGIQTLNPDVAVLIHRAGDPATELETLHFLSAETKAIVHADLIAGLPGEDFMSFVAGFDRLWQAATSSLACSAKLEIQLGILKCLPGTPLVNLSGGFGMVYSPEPPYEVLETKALPRADLDRLKNFARFWELIMNRHGFEEITPTLFPPGRPVFASFMALSDRLLAHFGRNWGIPRQDLRAVILNFENFPEKHLKN